MFDNVGEKIKGLALIMFIIELFATVITAIVLFTTDEDLIWVGFVVLIGGALISWASSLLLYGFGALIESNEKTENKVNEISNEIKIMKQMTESTESAFAVAGKKIPVKVYIDKDGRIKCPACGCLQKGDRKKCFCGQVFINGQDVPYWCGKCGKEGPFDVACPDCGSTMKIYNSK